MNEESNSDGTLTRTYATAGNAGINTITLLRPPSLPQLRTGGTEVEAQFDSLVHQNQFQLPPNQKPADCASQIPSLSTGVIDGGSSNLAIEDSNSSDNIAAFVASSQVLSAES